MVVQNPAGGGGLSQSRLSPSSSFGRVPHSDGTIFHATPGDAFEVGGTFTIPLFHHLKAVGVLELESIISVVAIHVPIAGLAILFPDLAGSPRLGPGSAAIDAEGHRLTAVKVKEHAPGPVEDPDKADDQGHGHPEDQDPESAPAPVRALAKVPKLVAPEDVCYVPVTIVVAGIGTRCGHAPPQQEDEETDETQDKETHHEGQGLLASLEAHIYPID